MVRTSSVTRKTKKRGIVGALSSRAPAGSSSARLLTWPAAGATGRQVLGFMGRRVLRRDRIDAYLSEHANVQVSHGLCPECLEEHYPEPED